MAEIRPEENVGSIPTRTDTKRRALLMSLLVCSVNLAVPQLFASRASHDNGQGERAKTAKSFGAKSEITAIDKSKRVITAKLSSDGQVFQFTPASDQELDDLKEGQTVFANFGTRQVFLDGDHVAGTITNVPAPTKGSAAKGLPDQKGLPSWNKGIITSINTNSGIITAKDNATGHSFEFRVANVGILSQLHLGQRILANFAGSQVSFDGKAALGAITKGPH
jgi:hypothetical protein